MSHPVENCPNTGTHEPHEWDDINAFDGERWCRGVEQTLTNGPKRYTLDEAKVIFLKQACDANGHQWAWTSNAQGTPLLVYCERGCGVPAGHIVFPATQPEEQQ